MNLARWRFPVSLRHDVAIPALVVAGLWATAAWYYHANTYPSGAVTTGDRAVALLKAKCGRDAPPGMSWHMQTALRDGTWVASQKLIDYSRLHVSGMFVGTVDASTGQVRNCITRSNDF